MSEILNEDQHLDPISLTNRRWYHRRMHAYLALGGIFAITGLAMIDSPLVPIERLAAASDVLGWVVITLGGVVVGYAGFNVLEGKMSKMSK